MCSREVGKESNFEGWGGEFQWRVNDLGGVGVLFQWLVNDWGVGGGGTTAVINK